MPYLRSDLKQSQELLQPIDLEVGDDARVRLAHRQGRIGLPVPQICDAPASLARSDYVGGPIITDVEDGLRRHIECVDSHSEDVGMGLDRARPLRDYLGEYGATYGDGTIEIRDSKVIIYRRGSE